jgi:hypothetical protein
MGPMFTVAFHRRLRAGRGRPIADSPGTSTWAPWPFPKGGPPPSRVSARGEPRADEGTGVAA